MQGRRTALGFEAFIPPNHLASFVFVSWTNGVPTVSSNSAWHVFPGRPIGRDRFDFAAWPVISLEFAQYAIMTDTEIRQEWRAGIIRSAE
jgi:hypothetical protein